MSVQLSTGSIQRIYNKETNHQPIVQVVDLKKIVSTAYEGKRYRLCISDGKYFMQGMLASQLSNLIDTNSVKKYSIIKLTDFVANVAGENKKCICVVAGCEVITHVKSQIGNPKNVSNFFQNNYQNNTNISMNNSMSNNMNNNMNMNNHMSNMSNSMNNNMNNRHPKNNFGNSNSYQKIQPISSLNPYQSGWTIKVKCTQKEEMRHYTNQKGPGRVFTVNFLDQDGGEIRCTMFNETADKFFGIFLKNSIYVVSKGQVKMARKGYTHIKNDYAIVLNNDSEVVLVNDDKSISDVKYAFVEIKDINEVKKNDHVDVIGVISHIGQIADILTRAQKQLKRRTIKVTDQTATIELTVWAEDAVEYNENLMENIIAIKGARVSDFGGRSLNPGIIQLNPQINEAIKLKQWWINNGKNMVDEIQTLTQKGGNAQRLSFSEVKEMKLGERRESGMGMEMDNNKQKGDFFSVICTISNIGKSMEKPPWYNSVPNSETDEKVKKAKVEDIGNGKWQCVKNNDKIYDSYTPRYILKFNACDFSGNLWFTAFDETATVILNNIPCTTVEEYYQAGNTTEYEKVFNDACFKRYVLKARARADTWEDQTRIRYDVTGVQLANPSQESKTLIEKIKQIRNM